MTLLGQRLKIKIVDMECSCMDRNLSSIMATQTVLSSNARAPLTLAPTVGM